MSADATELRIISPFIKIRALESLLGGNRPAPLQVMTRFNLTELAEDVSDIAALRALLDAGAQVRGVRNLHAKLYLFGSARAILTSITEEEAVRRSMGDKKRDPQPWRWMFGGRTLAVGVVAFTAFILLVLLDIGT